jgi:D-lactate dehydrogenase (cytochrome)
MLVDKCFGSAELFFPTDPTEKSASFGGMAACNASGARSFHYGSIRNYIEALRIILIDGSIIELKRGRYTAEKRRFVIPTLDGRSIGGELPHYNMPRVKNASGYFASDDMDLIDIFIGSEGTLGIITEIVVKLLPLPKSMYAVVAFMPNEESALMLVKAIRSEYIKKNIPIFDYKAVAIEYFNSASLQLLLSQKKNYAAFSSIQEIKDASASAVYVEFHGDNDDELLNAMQRLGDTIKTLGGNESDTWVAENERDLEKLLFFRHAVPESVNMHIDEKRKIYPAIRKLSTDMAVPDPYLKYMIDLYNKGIKKYCLDAVIFGHIGNNHVHVNIIPNSISDYKIGNDLYTEWAKAVADLGGAVSAEHGVGKLKKKLLPMMYGDEGIREMINFKRLFDPNLLLNAGTMFDI